MARNEAIARRRAALHSSRLPRFARNDDWASKIYEIRRKCFCLATKQLFFTINRLDTQKRILYI
jgi:hypothetical protein